MFQTIQACRAVAALLVVVFHVGGTLAKDKYFGHEADGIAGMTWFGGPAGVAFFFVLSGFIIMHVHRKDFDQPASLRCYVRKRLVRIYPTYWAVFIATCLAAMTVPALRNTLPTDPWLLIRSLLLVPQADHVPGVTGAPVISVAWSLQYEMVFYAVFALALWRRQALYVIVLAYIIGFVAYQMAPTDRFPASFFGSHLILLFGLGMLASIALRSRLAVPQPGKVAVAAALAFFATGLAANALLDQAPKLLLDLCYGVASAVLIVALIRYEAAREARFEHGAAGLLGDASYAIYLVHLPMISILCKLAVLWLPVDNDSAWLAFAVISLACVALGVGFHLLVERPLLARLNKPAAA